MVERVTGRGSDEPAYGDTLIDSMLGNISGLIPNITSDNYSHEVGEPPVQRAGRPRPRPEPRGGSRRVLDDQPRLPAPQLPAAPGRDLARRPALHRGRRHLHPAGDGESQDPQRLQGRLPGRGAHRGAGPLHGGRRVPDVLREIAPELGHAHPAPAPARALGAGREAQGVAGVPLAAGGHGALPLQGVEARREGRPRGERRLLRRPPLSGPGGLPGHSQPGHPVPRAEGQGHRRHVAHRAAVHAPDRLSGLSQGLRQVQVPVQRVHVLRPQPQGRAVRGSARPPRLRPRHQQARADRPRHSRTGGGRHRAIQAGHLGLQPERDAPIRTIPSGRGPSWRRRAGRSATPTASS